MGRLKQVIAVTSIGLCGIPKRPGPSAVIVISVAGVVAVLICVLALAQGFFEASTKAGRHDRAIVLGEGAVSEVTSRIPVADVGVVLDRAEIRRSGDSKPIASRESLAFVPFTNPRTGVDTIATLRGVDPAVLSLRPEIRIVSGRMFKPGVREVVVGEALQRRVSQIALGSHILLTQGSQWEVVGTFTSNGDSHESEMMTGSETLLSFLQRDYFNSITVALARASDFDSLKNAIAADPRVRVLPQREDEYFRESSAGRRRVMRFVAFFVGGVMALGAALAAVNAMYSVANKRAVEIATLRAIGFDGLAVVVGFLVEAMVLAAAGAAVGAAIAGASFNGSSVSPLNGFGSGALAYTLRVTLSIVAMAIGLACGIGLLGGFFPARRAASLPVAAVMSRG